MAPVVGRKNAKNALFARAIRPKLDGGDHDGNDRSRANGRLLPLSHSDIQGGNRGAELAYFAPAATFPRGFHLNAVERRNTRFCGRAERGKSGKDRKQGQKLA